MIAEEFGLVGGLALLALYVLVIAYAFAIALRSRSQFGRLLGLGIAVNFFLYVFINTAMVMGLIPVVGVPLPLISYGGTAMITVMLGFGLLMNVGIHRDVRISRLGESRSADAPGAASLAEKSDGRKAKPENSALHVTVLLVASRRALDNALGELGLSPRTTTASSSTTAASPS